MQLLRASRQAIRVGWFKDLPSAVLFSMHWSSRSGEVGGSLMPHAMNPRRVSTKKYLPRLRRKLEALSLPHPQVPRMVSTDPAQATSGFRLSHTNSTIQPKQRKPCQRERPRRAARDYFSDSGADQHKAH